VGEHLFWDFCCVAARLRNHPAKLDSAQKKTSVIDAHHPVN
jgi:hypothetical protein